MLTHPWLVHLYKSFHANFNSDIDPMGFTDMHGPSLLPLFLCSFYADVCVYKGVEYIQGQRWQDGCTYNCVCENGMTGKYKCTDRSALFSSSIVWFSVLICKVLNYIFWICCILLMLKDYLLSPYRCAAYPALPPYCSLVQDPKDFCCKQPLCNYQTQAPSIPPPVTPSPLPGQPTPSPNVNPTPAPNPNGEFFVTNNMEWIVLVFDGVETHVILLASMARLWIFWR